MTQLNTAADDDRYSAVLAMLAKLSAFLKEASNAIYELAGAPVQPVEAAPVSAVHRQPCWLQVARTTPLRNRS